MTGLEWSSRIVFALTCVNVGMALRLVLLREEPFDFFFHPISLHSSFKRNKKIPNPQALNVIRTISQLFHFVWKDLLNCFPFPLPLSHHFSKFLEGVARNRSTFDFLISHTRQYVFKGPLVSSCFTDHESFIEARAKPKRNLNRKPLLIFKGPDS